MSQLKRKILKTTNLIKDIFFFFFIIKIIVFNNLEEIHAEKRTYFLLNL